MFASWASVACIASVFASWASVACEASAVIAWPAGASVASGAQPASFKSEILCPVSTSRKVVPGGTCPYNRPSRPPGSSRREEILTNCLRGSFSVSRCRRRPVVLGSGQCTRRPGSLSHSDPKRSQARWSLVSPIHAGGRCAGHFAVLPAQDEGGQGGQRKGHRGSPAVQDDQAGAEGRPGLVGAGRGFAARKLTANQLRPRHAVNVISPNAIQPSARGCTSV